ncbi:MAG: methyltransferase [Thermodesulfobacteriota bacterium]|nr:methyltransferase [Thermodesulfobacteriota bacterium]
MNHPMDILESVRSFMKSRIILSGAELDLFTLIDRGNETVQRLAEVTGGDLRGLARLLDAIAAYGLLEKKEHQYRLTDAGRFLSANHPESVLPMVMHMNELWDGWSRLTDAVIKGRSPQPKSVSDKDEQSTRAFIGAMHVVGQQLSREIAADLDLSPYHRLLDIGGATGTYTIAFLEKNPELRAVIFDLPQVVPFAEERIAGAGMTDRVEFYGGDFYNDPLPGGCDLALLSAIIHQNSPAQNLELYRNIFQALLPGGTLLIRDHIMEEDRVHPPAGAIFAINMLSVTEGGDTYTFTEIKESLISAGFVDVHCLRQGEKMDGLVRAQKPA